MGCAVAAAVPSLVSGGSLSYSPESSLESLLDNILKLSAKLDEARGSSMELSRLGGGRGGGRLPLLDGGERTILGAFVAAP